MYLIRKPLGFVAVALAALSTVFCPFLKVALVGSWNMYEVDVRLFYITNGLLALVLLGIFLNWAKIVRFLSFTFMVWCLLAIIAVYFKTNNYFGMKLTDNLLSKTIHFKWGWIVLCCTALLLLFSVKKIKTENIA